MRAPLSGRRIRGYVVEIGAPPSGALKDLISVSGNAPVFDSGLLESLRWAANHYVAPLSVLLDRAAPPNLPGSPSKTDDPRPGDELPDHPLSAIARASAAGRRRPITAVVQGTGGASWLGALSPLVVAGQSALVVAATAREADELATRARAFYGSRVLVSAGDVAKRVTEAWTGARRPGRILIGTPRVATWSVENLGVAIVLEEGRRAMKDRQTPTLHVRDVLTHRARIEGFSLVFLGPTPSVEILAGGAEVVSTGARPWPQVEVVDRSDEAPGSGFLSEHVLQAIRSTVNKGERVLVFTHRRRSDASMRCTSCRAVRVCATCGSRLGRESSCRRCGAPATGCSRCGGEVFEEMGTVPDLLADVVNSRLGRGLAEPAPTDLPVMVGTERDLAGMGNFGLAVVADADGLMLGHDYRTGEEALRVLARVANTVGPGTGHRAIVQTSIPESPLIGVMRRGRPMAYLEDILAQRARDGLPPATEILALELGGQFDPDEVTADLAELDNASILGPARVGDHQRWLLQGSLGKPKLALRTKVQQWRDAGATVRLDADPIDL